MRARVTIILGGSILVKIDKNTSRLMDLFPGNETHHGTHGAPKQDDNSLKWAIRGSARTIRAPVTLDLWHEHVTGKRPLGVVPINSQNQCKWGSIDVDQYDVDVLEIVRRAERLPLVPCRSKSGGLHLFLFLTEFVDAKAVSATLRDMAATIGLSGCEIFPKQITLNHERGDLGSWIVMPYYGDDFGGKLKMQYGLKKSGAEMTLGEFVRMAESLRQTPNQIAEFQENARSPASTARSRKRKGGDSGTGIDDAGKPPFYDGPPCLTHIVSQEGGVGQGKQNNILFHMAVYFKKKNPDNWAELLERANSKFFNPPHPADRVLEIVKNHKKKGYRYKCKEQPMASHCDSTVCRMRRFGVGAGGTYPKISLTVVDIDPLLWVVKIDDEDTIEISTDELQSYMKFHRACMEQIKRAYAMIPQPVWMAIVAEAMSNMDPANSELTADEKKRHDYATGDIGRAAVFREILTTFLTNKQKGQKKEDLLSGRPWEDEEEGYYYFKLSSLEKFLRREEMRDVNRVKIVSMIRKIFKGENKQIKVKEKKFNMWRIRSSALERDPSVDPPDVRENPI